MKLFVAVPAYDRTVHAETVRSLLNEQSLAQGAGLGFEVHFQPGCSLVTMARNQLAQRFMDSDADRLIFLDSDVSFEPGALATLALRPVDFVGGAYRLKQDVESYPVGWLPKPELWAEDGLIEVMSLPGGFMCLTRKVLEDIREAFPGREYEHYGNTAYCWFDNPFMEGKLWGEDAVFCKYWRETGGKVWLDPELTLTHHDGARAFKGHIGNWLKGLAHVNAG